MGADEKKGYIFFETVISLKWQKHTYIECVPVPIDQFDDLPAYFKVCPIFSMCDIRQPSVTSM